MLSASILTVFKLKFYSVPVTNLLYSQMAPCEMSVSTLSMYEKHVELDVGREGCKGRIGVESGWWVEAIGRDARGEGKVSHDVFQNIYVMVNCLIPITADLFAPILSVTRVQGPSYTDSAPYQQSLQAINLVVVFANTIARRLLVKYIIFGFSSGGIYA